MHSIHTRLSPLVLPVATQVLIPPIEAWWSVEWIEFQLTTSAVVGDRRPVFTFMRGANELHTVTATQVCGAENTLRYTFGPMSSYTVTRSAQNIYNADPAFGGFLRMPPGTRLDWIIDAADAEDGIVELNMVHSILD